MTCNNLNSYYFRYCVLFCFIVPIKINVNGTNIASSAMRKNYKCVSIQFNRSISKEVNVMNIDLINLSKEKFHFQGTQMTESVELVRIETIVLAL